MAITRYAGDRFTIGDGDTKPTGVLDGAVLIDTGNLELYIKRNGAWVEVTGAGNSVVPGTPLNSVQFNNAGAFGGDADLTFTDGNRLNVNKLGISGNIYDSNNSIGNNGMVLTNEGATGVNWKTIEDVLSGVGGSGVANYVARWSDEDTLTSGVLVDNGTNVGINVPSPSYNLEIADSGSPTVRIEDTTNNSRLDLRAEDSSVLIRSTSNFPMRFDVNQTERMRIATDGNVGIGIASPSNILHVKHADPVIRLEDSSPDGLYGLLDAGGGDFIISADGGAGSANSFISFRVDGTAVGSEKMRITNGGNVGIGTNAPSQKLHVNGSTLINNNNYHYGYTSGGAQAVLIGIKSNNHVVVGQDNVNHSATNIFGGTGVIDFSTGGFTRVTIAVDGNVGIGTNAPSQKLHVNGTIKAGIAGDSSANTPALLVAAAGTSPQQSAIAIQQGTNEGDTIIFADYEPYVEYGINTDNGSDTIEFTGGTGTNNLGSKTLYNNAGSARTAYKKHIFSLSNGNFTAGGSVGIGTNNPSAGLHVVNGGEPTAIIESTNAGSSGSRLQLYHNSASPADNDIIANLQFKSNDSGGVKRTAALIQAVAADVNASSVDGDIRFSTYNADTQSEVMRITHDGNVGIGTNAPSQKLHVNGLTKLGGQGKTEGGAVVNYATFGEIKGGAHTLLGNAVVPGTANNTIQHSKSDAGNYIRLNYTAGIAFHTNITNTVNTDVTYDTNERMRIALDGNVGIGTDDPKYKLDVNTGLSAGGGIAYPIRVGHGSMANAGDGVGVLFSRGSAEQYFGYVRIQSTASNPSYLNPRLEFGIQDTDTFNLSDASTRMVINGDGNVGIGATNPLQKLEVFGNQRISNSGVLEFFGGTIYPQISRNSTSGGLIIDTAGGGVSNSVPLLSVRENGGTDFVTVLGSGNVGIGTTSPASKLEVVSAVDANTAIFRSTNNRASVKIQSSATSQSSYLSFINGSSQIAFIDGRYDDDYLRIATTKTEGFLAFETSTQVERVRITPDGNVGIGTTDPKGHLHVHSGSSGATVDVSSDNLIVESSNHGGISLLVPDNKASVITFGTSGDAIGAKLQWDYANNAFDMATAKAGGFIRFKVADQVEAIRITADGNVGIGDNIVDPEHRFHVSGDAIISGYLYDSTNSTGVDGYVLTSKEDGPQWKQIEDVLSGVGGSGVANYVARWSDEDTITSGTIYDNATKVGIGTSNPLHLLHVKGDVFISGKLYDATNSTGNKGYVLTSDDTGPVWAASGDFDTLSGNLIATGAIIDDISGNLIATGAIVDDISGNLITTGQTLTSNLISTGQTLQTQITSNDSDISTLTSNLITTGQTLTTNINTVATNLGTSGQTLQTQITSNDSDISTLTTNLGTTGQTLQTQITSNDSDISTLSSNLITTGQTLQTQITSNDSDISTLTSNLVTTGQTLTTNINTVSTNLISTGKIVDDISGNLITTGNFLESEIAIVSGLVSGDPEIVGTGTANFIPKFDDENSITDSIIKEVSSNIGISTASPAVKLDVVGLSGAPANTSTTQQGSLRLSQNGGNGVLDMGFYTSANGTAWLQSTNKANLSTNYDLSLQPNGGNVGISNTSPSAKLHIGGTFFDAANDLGTAALGIKQSGTSSENGIYIERSGERKGYYIGIAGVDGLTFRRNNGGTKSDIMSLTREGNVGIGTDSPEFKLQVENTVAAGSDNFILNVRNPTHASDSRAGIAFRMNSDTGSNWDGAGIQATNNGVDGAGHLTFGSVLNNSYTEHVRIQSDGKVGIGTNAPVAAKLEARATGSLSAANLDIQDANTSITSGYMVLNLSNSDTTTGNHIRLNFADSVGGSEGSVAMISAKCTNHSSNYGDLQFWTRGSASSGIRMHIDEDGNVGIGATNPLQKLEVFGNQRISNGGVLEFFGGTTYPQISRNSTSGGLIIDTAGGGVSNSVPLLSVRENGGTDFVTVLGSGNVGIGTVSPSAGLHVVNGGEPTAIIESTNAGSSGSRLQLYHNSASPANNDVIANIQFKGNDSNGTRRGAANIQVVAASVNSSSVDGDIRFRTACNDINSEVMRITHDGNVGIGTATVDSIFHVYSAATSMVRLQSASGNNDIGLDFYNGTDLKWQIRNNGNDHSFFIIPQSSTDSDAAFAITSDGNVGIGITDPSQKLHVNGLTKLGGQGKTEGGAVVNYATFGEIKGGAHTLLGNAVVPGTANNTIQHSKSDAGNYIRLNYTAGIAFHTNITNTVNTDVTYDTNERMRIALDGNVGIGTTNISQKLHVNGNCRIDGTQLISDVSVGYDWLQLYEPAGDGGSKIVSIERLAGGARLMLMDDGGSIKNKISSDAAQKTYFNNGSVGIGTASPVYGLDNKSSSIRTNSYTAEKTFGISFPNSTAHQKVDLSFPYFDGGLFWGYLEVTITSTYSNQLSTGKLAKVFSVGLNAPGGSAGSYTSQIYDNKSYYTSAYGAIATQWGIEGINFNSTTGQYYITIAHRVSTGNSIRVSVKAYGYSADYLGSNRFGGLSVGSVYTTDTTVFDDPVIQVPEFHVDANNSNHNLKIGTRGGNMNLFSFTDAGAGAPLAFEGTEFRFISGSVGIGTTSISILSGAKLDVRGNIYSQGYYFSKSGALVGGNITLTNQAGDADSNDFTITASHSTNSVVLRAAQKVEFWTYAGGAYNQRMVILNNGCVGIGTNSASSKLHVYGGELVVNQTTVGDNIIDLQNNGDTAFKIDTSATINYLYLISPPVGSASGVTALYASASKTLGSWMALKDTAGSDSHTISSWAGVVFNETGSSIDFRIEGGTEQNLFFVDGSSDRIGIGTNSPITTLNLVNNDESTTQTNFTQALTNAGILITTEYTAGAYTPGIFWNTSDNNATKPKAGIYLKEASNGSNLYFGTSNSYATGITNDAMVINQNGCVKLGAYGSGTCTGTAAYKLSVDSSGNIIETPIGAGAVDGAGTTNYVTKWTDSDTIGNSLIRDDGTNVGIGTTGNGYKLRVQGDVYISGNLTEASSAAIKENIETYSPSLDIINKLRPVTYNKKKNKKKEIGLIAEELVELFPELVEIDKDGKPTGINYSRAVTVLLGGFKELYKEVQELKKRI